MTYSVDILGDCFDGPAITPTSPMRACCAKCGRLSSDGVDLIRTCVFSVIISLRLLPLNKRTVAAAMLKGYSIAH